MNSSGWVREMLAKSMNTEGFITHVVSTIHQQLKDWDQRYHVKLLEDLISEGIYYVVVTRGKQTFKVVLTKSEVEKLQEKSPYALDQLIWRGLVDKGLRIEVVTGNYLTHCAI